MSVSAGSPYIHSLYNDLHIHSALWTKDSRNQQAILAIGHKMKQLLQLREVELQYQVHKDAMVQAGPNVNAIYKL